MSATSKTGEFASRLSRIAHSWPTDPFRPNMQLKTFMQSLSEHPNLTPAAVDAAQALEANAAVKKYPISARTLKPASAPHHYDRLNEGFLKAAQGVKRPWWKIFFNIW